QPAYELSGHTEPAAVCSARKRLQCEILHVRDFFADLVRADRSGAGRHQPAQLQPGRPDRGHRWGPSDLLTLGAAAGGRLRAVASGCTNGGRPERGKRKRWIMLRSGRYHRAAAARARRLLPEATTCWLKEHLAAAITRHDQLAEEIESASKASVQTASNSVRKSLRSKLRTIA